MSVVVVVEKSLSNILWKRDNNWYITIGTAFSVSQVYSHNILLHCAWGEFICHLINSHREGDF